MTTATNTSLGLIKLAGDLAGNNDGLAPSLTTALSTPGAFVAPSVTVDTKGRVTAISSTSGSAIAALIPDASTSVRGVVKIGENINVSTSTTSGYQIINFGGALVGSASTGLCNNGASYSFNLMRDNVGPLVVTLVANTITTVDELISEVNLKITPFTIALVGGNLKISSNTSGPLSSVGINADEVFKYMSGFVAILSAVIGTGDGVISVSTATSSVKGVASFSDDFSVVGGNVSVTLRDATTSTKGVVQIGSGLSVTSGVVSVPNATTSTKGVVQIGSGLSVTSGVVSATVGSNTVPGIVKSNNSSNISIVAGAIDVGANVPLKNQANVFTKAQVVSLVNLTASASVTPDFSLGNVFYLNPTSNFALNAPTGVVAGGTYIIIVKQDATGSRVCTFNSAYKFGLNAVSTLSTAAGKVDIISITAQTSSVLLTSMQIGF